MQIFVAPYGCHKKHSGTVWVPHKSMWHSHGATLLIVAPICNKWHPEVPDRHPSGTPICNSASHCKQR